MSSTLTTALTAGIAILILQLLYLLRKNRSLYKDFPQPKRSPIWGHLKVLNDAMSSLPKSGQIDLALQNMAEELGNPPIMLLDLWPVNYPMAIINSHSIAEQISKASRQFPYSVPKSDTMAYLAPLLGKHALVTVQAEEWKFLRKRFNPGFAPQHLLGLLPAILEKVDSFLQHLDRLAETAEVVRLGDFTTNLTFDVIGTATMDMDLGAQRERSERHPVMNLYVDLVDSFKAIDDTPIAVWLLHPQILARQRRLAREIYPLLKKIVEDKHAELKRTSESGGKTASRSVLALSLQGVEHLTPELLDQTCDNLKTFLFAGHDTTSIVLQWCFYELERSPSVANRVCAELDDIFGPDPDPQVVMAALLERGEEAMAKMTYTSAFIKEVLRMYPPGGSARRSEPGSGLVVTAPNGERYCLDGMMVYNCATTIQRDEAAYGPTKDLLVPERWLDDDEQKMSIPASAWRPFERGPRNCIGQELANIETKIILACVARRYSFVKVGLGAVVRDEDGNVVLDGDGRGVVERELYSSRQVTAKPVDGLMARVEFKQMK